MGISQRENAACKLIESMLFAAMERKATGNIDDVLLRIIENEIYSLSDFKQNAAEYLKRLHESAEPIVLTVNRKA